MVFEILTKATNFRLTGSRWLEQGGDVMDVGHGDSRWVRCVGIGVPEHQWLSKASPWLVCVFAVRYDGKKAGLYPSQGAAWRVHGDKWRWHQGSPMVEVVLG
jgi:hypothetical protein